MSSDSSSLPGPEVVMFCATSDAELEGVLSKLRPSLTYPLLVSILLETPLTQRYEADSESGFDSFSTISRLQ